MSSWPTGCDRDPAAPRAHCKSAQPVPSAIPDAEKGYEPKSEDGKDFDSGDATTGWRCLKFAFTQPIHCQYSYIAGGPFKSTERGNEALAQAKAKEGDVALAYEASAECDFDGDGKTSLYATWGTVNPTTQRLKRATEVFEDE